MKYSLLSADDKKEYHRLATQKSRRNREAKQAAELEEKEAKRKAELEKKNAELAELQQELQRVKAVEAEKRHKAKLRQQKCRANKKAKMSSNTMPTNENTAPNTPDR